MIDVKSIKLELYWQIKNWSHPCFWTKMDDFSFVTTYLQTCWNFWRWEYGKSFFFFAFSCWHWVLALQMILIRIWRIYLICLIFLNSYYFLKNCFKLFSGVGKSPEIVRHFYEIKKSIISDWFINIICSKSSNRYVIGAGERTWTPTVSH